MDVTDVVSPHIATELANGFDERNNFDVAYRPANLDDDYVNILRIEASDPLFNLVGDMGNDLDCLAEVVPSSLFSDH